MKRISSIATGLALLVLSNFANAAGTEIPLNTGYDYSTQLVFVPPPANTSLTRDQYWINIASYPATTPPTDISFLINTTGAPWAPAMTYTSSAGATWGSSWISAWNKNASQAGTTSSNPAYTIFRKCFCLQDGFTLAKVSVQIRGDDTIQCWLNTQLQTLVPPSLGNWNASMGPALSGSTTNQAWFHVGVNCVYVLLEDYHGNMGFDLVGSISAIGLLAEPAKGFPGSFGPCSCSGGPAPLKGARGVSQDDDQQVINEIIKIAEARRMAKQKIQDQGKEPKK